MMSADHPAIPFARIGVLIVNLGTPDAPEPAAVKRYLAEFLSDRRVIEIPQWIWQPILRGIILNVRPKKSAKAYREVWTEDGSPLAAYTKAQAAALSTDFAERFGDRVMVDYAMRYGQPSIAARIAAMKRAGCTRILIAPLYPQYCGATTASVQDAAFAVLGTMRWQPAIRTLPNYHDHPAYIAALATSVRDGLAALSFQPDAIMATFHGMPQRTLELGDPYHCQCLKTARLLGEALGREMIVTFQSRFGRAKWLEPATDQVLAGLPGKGVKRLAVVAPGFAVDCLETLEEIAIRGKQTFLGAGGNDFAYLTCLNASPVGVRFLSEILVGELEGWVAAA